MPDHVVYPLQQTNRRPKSLFQDSLARRPCTGAIGSLVLSTMLAAGVITAGGKSIVDLPQVGIDPLRHEFVGRISEPRLRGERNPPTAREDGGLRQPISEGEIGCLTRPTKPFPRLAYSHAVGRAEGDARSAARPLSRFARRVEPPAEQDAAEKESAPATHEPTRESTREPWPALVLSDPFHAAATSAVDAAAVETPRKTQAESIDDYLFAAYRRLPEKRDASGDFTWKDAAAAARMGLSLEDYVIGGMDPDFKELIYAAGKQMDAAGIQWSMLSAFRDDWRQEIASGFKASAGNSCHGGSRRVGGYGFGHCVDLWAAAGPVEEVLAFIDRAGAAIGLKRPMPGRDPAHVQPIGEWRAIAERLRAERLKEPMIATVQMLGGADTAAGLTELAGGRATEPPTDLSATMASSEGPEGPPPAGRAALRPRLVLAAAESRAALHVPAAPGVHAALRVRAALHMPAASHVPAVAGGHKVHGRPATAAAAPHQHARTRLSAAIRGAKRT